MSIKLMRNNEPLIKDLLDINYELSQKGYIMPIIYPGQKAW